MKKVTLSILMVFILTSCGGSDSAAPTAAASNDTVPIMPSDSQIITAVNDNDPVELQKLIDAGGDVNAKDDYGKTALMLASSNGRTAIAELLIAADADLKGALIYASSNGQTAIAELLIPAGADVNEKDDYGYTALILASRSGHTDFVIALIDAGADVNAKDNAGKTALKWAWDIKQSITDGPTYDHDATIIALSKAGGTL